MDPEMILQTIITLINSDLKTALTLGGTFIIYGLVFYFAPPGLANKEFLGRFLQFLAKTPTGVKTK